MLDNTYNILCFGYMPWSEMWKRNQSMMNELSKLDFINKLIFINPEISVRSLFNFGNQFNRKGLFRSLFLAPRKFGENIFIHTPVHFLPFKNKLKILDTFDNEIILRSIKRSNNDMPYILVINSPNIASNYLLDKILTDAQLSIFDFSDDFVELIHNKKTKNKYLSNITKYAKRVDIVLTVNEHLKSKYADLNKNIFTVKNATNFSNFDRESYRPVPYLENLKKDGTTLIGYIGIANTRRIDSNMLEHLLRKRPQWQFVFIGKMDDALIEYFSKYPNYHHLPAVSYKKLPDHINYFDATIVPFKINDHTKGNDLLKLHDYLSMGKPVVSTAIGGAIDLKNIVEIASNPDEFLQQIENSISNQSDEKIKNRKKIALKNSWPFRVLEVEKLIRNHLDI